MASYVHKKERAFRDANALDLVPRRSEGRMKTYPSATDARAWCDEIEERRQHIIELIRKDISKGVSLGKFVPIDVIIDTLVANKCADIAKLKEQLEELQQLLDMYEKLDLTEDQKRQLGQQKQKLSQMKKGMDKKGTTGTTGGTDDTDGGKRVPVDEAVITKTSTSTVGAQSIGAPSKLATELNDVDALKQALAEKEAEVSKQRKIARQAIEQLEEIQDIVEERDRLKKQLEQSKHEVENLRRGSVGATPGGSGGQAQALQAQMEELREKGQLTPEQEVALMKQQLEAVKQDCAKLGTLQAENSKLKKELEAARAGTQRPRTTADAGIDADDNVDSLRQKLHDATEDRDKLRDRCQQLESELLKYGDLPGEVEILQQRSKALDSVISERDSLYIRLKELEGIEEEVKELKARADRASDLEKQLAQLKQEMQQDRRSSDAQAREAADLKSKAKEGEVMKVERDQLRMRVDQLANIEAQYMDLLDKTRGFDALKNERDLYKQKYEELLGLECECDILRAQLENAKDVDKERDALQRQVRECECCIADQEDEIKRLVTHIDRLTNGKDNQQERAKEVIANMRKELDDKDQLLTSSAEQLAQVQDQLKSTIQNVTSETAQLKARLEELERLLKEKDDIIEKLTRKERESEQKRGQKDDLIDKMRAELEAARAENEKLQHIAEEMAHFTGDEHFKDMLRQSKVAVEKVKEHLEAQYDEWDCVKKKREEQGSATDLFGKYSEERQKADALEADLEKCRQRVKELEAQLQEARKLIGGLREQTGEVDQISAENLALRRHSAEVQDVAKEQIEELVEHLRKAREKIAELEAENDKLRRRLQDTSRILETVEDTADSDSLQKLRKELEDVQKEKDKLEALIKSLQEGATGDDAAQELMRLKMEYAALEDQLQKEIQRRQEAESRVQALEEELKGKTAGGDTQELERLKAELKAANEEVARLEDSLLKQKTESEQKVARLNRELDDLTDTVKESTRRSSVQATELEEELRRLKAENDKLQTQLKETRDALSTAAQTESKVVDTAAKAVDTSELNALREERDKLLKQIEEQNKEISNLLEQMKSGADAAAVAELEKQRKEKEALQDLINKLEKQVKDLSSSQQVTDTSDLTVAETVKKLSEQLETEERNAKEWKTKHEKCQEELEKLRQQLKTGATTVSTTQADNTEINDLKSKLEKCQQELEKLREKEKDLNAKYEKSQQELGTLKTKTTEVKPKDEKGQQQPEKLTEKTLATTQADNTAMNELKAQYDKCQQELEKLRQQYKEKTGESTPAITQADNTEVNDLKQKCQEEIEKLKQQLRDKDDLLEIEKKKTADAEVELQQMLEAVAGGEDGAVKAMQNTMKDLKSENETLQKEIAALKQKVNKLEEENRKLKEQLGGAVTEVERTRRTSKEWEKKYSQSESSSSDELQRLRDTIASLKEQYDRDIKNLHNKHDEAVAKLQEQHEQAMKDLREEYEKEINSLRDQLKAQQGEAPTTDKTDRGSLTSKTMEVVDIKPKKCTCGSKLERILQKALKDGMEALNFDELKYVHSKVCDCTTDLLNKGATKDGSTPRQLPASMESEKFLLLQKINALEKDLIRKQKQTQLKVAQLQIAVRIERERLEELRSNLDEERSRNGELLNKIGAQNKTVANMQMERELLRKQTTRHEEKLENLIMAIEEERGMMESLQQELKKEKGHVKKLKTALDQERARAKTKDRELEAIRIKYEKALNSEMMLKMELEQKPHENDPSDCSAPCSLIGSLLRAQDDGTAIVPVPDPDQPSAETTTFYTELTIRDAQNRQNFVQNTIMRRAERNQAAPSNRRRDKTPARPQDQR